MRLFPADFPRLKGDAISHPKYLELFYQIQDYAAVIQAGASENWLLSRTYIEIDGQKHFTIGGSEMATVIGVNKYQKPEQLVEVKASLIISGKSRVETDSDAVRAKWGHLVEPILRRRCNIVLGTDVLDVPISIPHPVHKNIRYTPDGIAVVRMTTKDVVGPKIDKDEAVIALIEFKNPFDRVVGEEVPVYYGPQVQTGLEVIPIVEIGVYHEANWKIKPLFDLLQPPYNAALHMRGTLNGKLGAERFDGLQVIDATVIVVYCTDENPLQRIIHEVDESSDYDVWLTGVITAPSSLNRRVNIGQDVIDFGKMSMETMTALMNLIEFFPDKIKTDFISLCGEIEAEGFTYDNTAVSKLLMMKCREHKNVFGIIPIGLYKEGFHVFYKNQFLKKHEDKIQSFIQKLAIRVEELGGPSWAS